MAVYVSPSSHDKEARTAAIIARGKSPELSDRCVYCSRSCSRRYRGLYQDQVVAVIGKEEQFSSSDRCTDGEYSTSSEKGQENQKTAANITKGGKDALNRGSLTGAPDFEIILPHELDVAILPHQIRQSGQKVWATCPDTQDLRGGSFH
jgi:hypothetical protein